MERVIYNGVLVFQAIENKNYK